VLHLGSKPGRTIAMVLHRNGPTGWIGPILGAGLAISACLPSAPWSPAPVHSLELRGSTYFTKPPSKLSLVSFSTDTGSQSEYYVTIPLSPEAGASLGRLTIQQIRGADWQFPFSPERTRAFLGRPRHEGLKLPVTAEFNDAERRFTIDFPEPVPPGETVTVVLKPWFNPIQADTYLFQVVAWPAGPNPVASPVGVGTLRIYQPGIW